LEATTEYEEEAGRYLSYQHGIFVSSCEAPCHSKLTSISASITSIVRLKFLLKYANTYDSTWDNVDVIKWSLIEILAACICGNTLPLRPLLKKMVPPVRSFFSWYTRSISRKSSEKNSSTSSKFNWRDKTPKKPNLISTFDFTKFSVASHLVGKSEVSEISPRTPCPAHMDEKRERVGVHVQPHHVDMGVYRDIPTQGLDSMQTTTTDSEGRLSRSDSEGGLMPGSRACEFRRSGPWSYALGIFDRK
jgi:hypothetical protein